MFSLTRSRLHALFTTSPCQSEQDVSLLLPALWVGHGLVHNGLETDTLNELSSEQGPLPGKSDAADGYATNLP